MKEITFDRDNIGGLHRIIAIPPSLYTMEHDYATGENSLEITDDSQAVAIHVYADGTYLFGETHGRDEVGDWWQPTITGTIPKLCPGNAAIIEELERGQWVVLCEDSNGVLRLCGDSRTPLSFGTDATTGGATTDINGTAFTFTGKLGHTSPFISEVV